jgi:phosphate/sulfate permease
MDFVFFDLDGILEFVQANGYKDFMTWFILTVVVVSFAVYLFSFIRKEIKKDKKKY